MAECHFETKQAKELLGAETIYGHHGYCGDNQYRTFAKWLEPYESAGWLRVGLTHHNHKRNPTHDDENLLDADRLDALLAPKLNFLLHGHTHVGARSQLPHGQPILATGSASLGINQRPNETPNQYQIYLRVALA